MSKALSSGGAARLRAVLCWTLLCAAGAAYAADTAAVGKGSVTEKDIKDWQAAQACYGPEALTSRQAAFMRLYEAAILDEVLAAAGRPITKAEYAAEVARIDSETRAPDILACIRKYFGKKTDRYERVFVRPILAQRFVREFVKADPKVQARAFGLRDKIAAIVYPSSVPVEGIRPFAEIGAELGVDYSSSAYTMEAEPGDEARGPDRWSPFEPAFIEDHLRDLKPGDVKPVPIEDELSFRFVRFNGLDGKKYRFETLTVNKLSTEAYLKRAAKVQCWISDPELRGWVAGIRGNPLLAPAQLMPGDAPPPPAKEGKKGGK